MGFSYLADDSPRMCFNGPKSWQLGWYNDKAIELDPVITPGWSGRLVGIAEYNLTGSDDAVLIKVETGTDVDYYINLNRQTGVNSETQEGKGKDVE